MHYIMFPKLHLYFNIDPVAVTIGNLDIYWYGIIIAVAVTVGYFLAMRIIEHFGYTKDDVSNVLMISTIVGVVCARMYYVVFNFDMFRDNLLDILNLRTGGLAIYGGIIGAVVSVYIYCVHKKYNFLNFIDVLIPYLALGQSIGRWGNFANQEAFGVNTDMPWGMSGDLINKEITKLMAKGVNITKDLVHPTFLYESIINIIIFIILCKVRKNKKFDGSVLCLYMILYGIARFFIEGLRIDSLMFLGFRVSKVLSFLLVVIFSFVFFHEKRKQILNKSGE